MAFFGTVILMQIPPGPDNMLVIARGIGQGRGCSPVYCARHDSGRWYGPAPASRSWNILIDQRISAAFKLLQWAGSAYLIWLGLKLLLSPSASPTSPGGNALGPLAAAREGMIANLVNP